MGAEFHVFIASQTAYISLTNERGNKQRKGRISSMYLAQTVALEIANRERKKERQRHDYAITTASERLNERESLPFCTSVAVIGWELQLQSVTGAHYN